MAGLVVITRPINEARDYAAELQDAGFESLIEPMLEIKPCGFEAPDLSAHDGILLTSANSVRCYADGGGVVSDIHVYCVGKYTAQTARDVGFDSVISVDGTGADLLGYILGVDGLAGGRFLHVCGRHVAFPIVEGLKKAGVLADALVVYESVQVNGFSDGFMEALEGGLVDAVTFYSKRTADAFVANVVQSESESLFEGIKALCISDAVVKCVRVLPWAASYVSKTPDRDGMMRILRAYV